MLGKLVVYSSSLVTEKQGENITVYLRGFKMFKSNVDDDLRDQQSRSVSIKPASMKI